MKKILFLLVICLILLPNVYGNDYEFPDEKRGFFPVKDRVFEIGLGLGANVSNNFLSIGEIFSEILVLDLDKLALGINADFGVKIPFNINLNFSTWGIGIFAGVDVTGGLGLNGNMLSFKTVNNAKSDFNAAVFAFGGVDSHFYIQQFKVKFRPAVFYPIVYVMPEKFSYTFNSPDGLTQLIVDYDITLYSAGPINNIANLNTSPGFDFSLGVEYPISEITGINRKIPILDFDIGLDLVNVPIIASIMNNYMRIDGGYRIKQEEDDELQDLLDKFGKGFSSETKEGTKRKSVDRAFKMFFWADWRPLYGNPLLSVMPVLGFALNDLYQQPFSMEAGIRTSANLGNMFVATAGINYEDRLFKNSLNLTFNCRALQLDFGAELQSPNFLASWTAKGFGANIGVKFGW